MSITFSKVESTEVKEGKRELKVNEYGVKTAKEVSSFGDDSNPTKNLTALYANTAETGDSVILGYINIAQLEELGIGEKRIYSTNEEGEVQFFIRLLNNGTCYINSDGDNAVRYSKLEEAFNELKEDFNNAVGVLNDFIGKYNQHTNPQGGNSIPPQQQGETAQESQADIVPSKIQEIFVPPHE